jgi:hypothetical protein
MDRLHSGEYDSVHVMKEFGHVPTTIMNMSSVTTVCFTRLFVCSSCFGFQCYYSDSQSMNIHISRNIYHLASCCTLYTCDCEHTENSLT